MARVYKQSAIYDSRVASFRNLWEPSTEFQGKRMEKPNYLITVIIKKTRANWFEEPALAEFTQSCKALYDAAMSHIPFQQVNWPFKDGDAPDPLGRTAEWRTGHWILNGSSTSPIETFINVGGVPTPLRNRDHRVKQGDYVSVTTSIAVKTGDPRGVKVYINKVVFQGEGEEIVMGNSVGAGELMAKAKEAGLNVTGFGGGGAPQQGFGQVGAAVPFPAPNGPQTGFAPSPISPPAQQGFGAPGLFIAPTGFPPRQ